MRVGMLRRVFIFIAVVCVATGFILDLVAHVRREAKLLAYLEYPAPRQAGSASQVNQRLGA